MIHSTPDTPPLPTIAFDDAVAAVQHDRATGHHADFHWTAPVEEGGEGWLLVKLYSAPVRRILMSMSEGARLLEACARGPQVRAAGEATESETP